MGMYGDAAKRVGTGLYLKLDAGKKRIRIIDHPYVSNRPGFKPEDPIRTVFTWLVWNYCARHRASTSDWRPGSDQVRVLRRLMSWFASAWRTSPAIVTRNLVSRRPSRWSERAPW